MGNTYYKLSLILVSIILLFITLVVFGSDILTADRVKFSTLGFQFEDLATTAGLDALEKYADYNTRSRGVVTVTADIETLKEFIEERLRLAKEDLAKVEGRDIKNFNYKIYDFELENPKPFEIENPSFSDYSAYGDGEIDSEIAKDLEEAELEQLKMPKLRFKLKVAYDSYILRNGMKLTTGEQPVIVYPIRVELHNRNFAE